ncbi:hypothetical protein JL720_13616 [Aureococcus anophagefferens]|nr:hypothetical protein JL720_13616 [Aureococcus anophagefferens]
MCGNLGLLLVGHDGDAAPEALLEEMARVVAMRGAQSYGFVAAAGGKSMTMHKAVLTKRDDIATALRRAVRRRVGARALGTRPLLLAAHLRFATSSRSTAVEAHPHSWLGPVAALPPAAPGAPPPKPTRRLVVITHNGDFEGLDVGRCFGCDLPVMALDALRAWLAVRLGRAPPEWDLRSAVWRFLKTAHGAFGLCATTSLAPGRVLGSVKQPLIVGVGRGFVAYASERAAVHVGAIGAALKYRYVLAEGDAVSIAPEATAVFDADRMRRSSLDVVASPPAPLCGYRSPAVAALDALLYAFFPVVAALVLRFVQKRTMLARFGRRTIMVLDVPMVHQCAVAFGQKLFGLSYGLNGLDVSAYAALDMDLSRGGTPWGDHAHFAAATALPCRRPRLRAEPLRRRRPGPRLDKSLSGDAPLSLGLDLQRAAPPAAPLPVRALRDAFPPILGVRPRASQPTDLARLDEVNSEKTKSRDSLEDLDVVLQDSSARTRRPTTTPPARDGGARRRRTRRRPRRAPHAAAGVARAAGGLKAR